jgi:hypothetical protein
MFGIPSSRKPPFSPWHFRPTLGTFVLLIILSTPFGIGTGCDQTKNDSPLCNGYGPSLYLGELDSRLDEISGLAFSRRYPGVFYAHNDSGHQTEIFVMNTERELLGVLWLSGIENQDWEDIAVGPCGGSSCIYIADTGDNEESREAVAFHRIPEPDLDPNTPFGYMRVDSITTTLGKYLDQPHDVEALIVNTMGGLYVFTKQAGGSSIFQGPDSDGGAMKYVGHLNFRPDWLVTAADYHPSGDRVILKVRDHVLEYNLTENLAIGSMLQRDPSIIPAVGEEQGESIGYDPDTGAIYHAAEVQSGDAPALYRMVCAP